MLNAFKWDVEVASVNVFMGPVLRQQLRLLTGYQFVDNEHIIDIFVEKLCKYFFNMVREILDSLPDEARLQKAKAIITGIAIQLRMSGLEMYPNLLHKVILEVNAIFGPFDLVMEIGVSTP